MCFWHMPYPVRYVHANVWVFYHDSSKQDLVLTKQWNLIIINGFNGINGYTGFITSHGFKTQINRIIMGICLLWYKDIRNMNETRTEHLRVRVKESNVHNSVEIKKTNQYLAYKIGDYTSQWLLKAKQT